MKSTPRAQGFRAPDPPSFFYSAPPYPFCELRTSPATILEWRCLGEESGQYGRDTESDACLCNAGPQPTPVRRVLPERLLAKLWMARAGRRMRTTDGRGLKVVYPGRPAPGHGPDFRDAVLELDGKRVHGPVELHRTPGDWKAHGHDEDPAYADVVLHVVGGASSGGPAMPTVEISGDDAAEGPAPGKDQVLGGLSALDNVELLKALRRAGIVRFQERTERAGASVARQGIEQTLYAGIMEALGYAENREPFAELAHRLPAPMLRAAVMAFPAHRRPGLLRDLLAPASGLAPASEAWLTLGASAPMERSAWHLAGVRPSNHPLRRLDSAAALLAQALPHGLAAWLGTACLHGPHALVLAIRAPGRDADSEGTGVASAGRNGEGMGEQRAREIAVNAVLPTLLAWARAKKDRVLVRACVSCYERFPSLGENTVTREARRLLGERDVKLRLGACQHQGLMHLYRKAVGR